MQSTHPLPHLARADVRESGLEQVAVVEAGESEVRLRDARIVAATVDDEVGDARLARRGLRLGSLLGLGALGIAAMSPFLLLFLLGGAVARELQVGVLAVRKGGKLPPPVLAIDYSLEYGQATLGIPADAERIRGAMWALAGQGERLAIRTTLTRGSGPRGLKPPADPEPA